MQKDYFFNGGGTETPPPPPPPLQIELTMPEWNWACSQDHEYAQFEIDAAAGPAVSGGYAIRELIGKIGSICAGAGGSPPPFAAVPTNDNNVNNYTTTASMNSGVPCLGNLLPPLPAPASTGGRAAKFSCLGNRSFNGRTGQFGLKNGNLPYGSNGNLHRVSSSPSLKQSGSLVQNNNSGPVQPEMSPDNPFPRNNNSNEDFSVPEELNHIRKRTVSRRHNDEDDKGIETDDHAAIKRSKPVEVTESDNNGVKTEEEQDGNINVNNNNNSNSGDKKSNEKPLDPQKDYIHVRARRGQATDSHSLAERVRREKISERMKLLQDLVPGCNKVTGKALMLDEIINYVQSLQQQVEFLSMKLATVDTRPGFDSDKFAPKDMCQSSVALYQMDSSEPPFNCQTPQLHANVTNGIVSQRYPLMDTSPGCSLGMQFPPIDGFGENLAQSPSVFEDDLQSIVHMGFNRISSKDTTLHPRSNQNGDSIMVHAPLI